MGRDTRRTTSSASPLLVVEDLRVRAGDKFVVDGVSFAVSPGETVALVGESGSGKSLTSKAIAGLLPPGLELQGSIKWNGSEIATSVRAVRPLRGRQIGMLLQDPFTLFNPLTRIGKIMAEALSYRRDARRTRKEISNRILEVGIDPSKAIDKYPWELSGGMRQRIGLATSMEREPALLIADEPTTALDATTQREVLRLIHTMQADRRMALLLITHDLRVAMSMSDRILVMSQGRIVEAAKPDELRSGGSDPYTRRLWAAELPTDRRIADLRVETRLESPAPAVEPRAETSVDRVLSVADLTKRFGGNETDTVDESWALRGVSFSLKAGRSLGVIGESGSGKTTLARCILGLEVPTSGQIEIEGNASPNQVQCVFQDPYSSLNPRHTVGFALAEAIRYRSGPTADRSTRAHEIRTILEDVGLPGDLARRRPQALSGGQRQRVAIARALLMHPKILVCDEPVAALDLTVQAQVLHLLREAQDAGQSMLFITHDVSVARQMTDDLIVLYKGEIVESGETGRVLDDPQHPYTQRLLSSVPTAEPTWLAGP